MGNEGKRTNTIVIVGAGKGIGFATARLFHENGFQVALISRNVHKLTPQINTLGQQGNTFKQFYGDVAKPETIASAFGDIRDQLGKIDVLLYNVANIHEANVLEESAENLLADYQVYAPALHACTLLALEDLKATKGALLVTGGAIAYEPNPDYAALSVGKAAVANLTRSLSAMLSKAGVYTGLLSIQGHVSADKRLHHPDNIARQLWNMYADRVVFEVFL